MIARKRLNVTLYVHCLSCEHCYRPVLIMIGKRYIRADEEPKKKVEVIGQVRQGNEHCCSQTLFSERIDCSFD